MAWCSVKAQGQLYFHLLHLPVVSSVMQVAAFLRPSSSQFIGILPLSACQTSCISAPLSSLPFLWWAAGFYNPMRCVDVECSSVGWPILLDRESWIYYRLSYCYLKSKSYYGSKVPFGAILCVFFFLHGVHEVNALMPDGLFHAWNYLLDVFTQNFVFWVSITCTLHQMLLGWWSQVGWKWRAYSTHGRDEKWI
jgi:hypothetical protein